MTSIAVIAHEKKSLGGGLPELRRLLADRGFPDPIWYQVTKTREASAFAGMAIEQGADLIFLWGGDGTIQHCVDAVAGSGIAMAILPAGTANLLATNLRIPIDLSAAVDVGLHGARRSIDVGVLNGERFAVMAGAGLDAQMMKNAKGQLKERFGRLAYVWSGIWATRMARRTVRVNVDGECWFEGQASCVLLGNMGTLFGHLTVFPAAEPDDGKLEVGVVTAEGLLGWARILVRVATRHAERSSLARVTQGREVDVKFDTAIPYELDGSVRSAKRRLRVTVEPGALSVCVPETRPESKRS
jgi:YegS/Rv2252/BmrU family lipid kinase